MVFSNAHTKFKLPMTLYIRYPPGLEPNESCVMSRTRATIAVNGTVGYMAVRPQKLY